MDRDTAVQRILERLGRAGDAVLQTRVETELVNVQHDILEANEWLPWFLQSSFVDLATVADQVYVDVPEGFLIEDDEEGGMWRYDADNTDNKFIELKKDDHRVLAARYPDTGIPLAYSLRGEQFFFFPLPDGVYPLKLTCYMRDDPLDTNIENLWLKHAGEVVLAETCFKMASEHIKNMEDAQLFRAAATTAWQRLYKRHIARREAGSQRAMGDE